MEENLIEKIKYKNQLLAIVVKKDYRTDGINFFSESEMNQQIGSIKYPSGHVISRHTHKSIERNIIGTSEIIFIKEGIVKTEIYNDKRELVKSIILEGGDFISLISGGHGFKVLKDALMIEVKQGPYLGKDDKERF